MDIDKTPQVGAGIPKKPRRLGRRIGLIAALLAVLAGGAGAVFFAGFEVGKRQVFPYALLDRIDAALVALIRPAPDTPPTRLTRRVFPAAFFRLTAEVVPLRTPELSGDTPIDGWGGGITSFGDDALVLAYNGRIYAASGADDVRRTAIIAPDNNRAAYLALPENPDFAQFEFRDKYLRYNDILAFEGPDGAQGLIVSYTEFHPAHESGQACYTSTLARLDIAPEVTSIDAVTAGPDAWQVFFRTAPCLPFKPLYVAMEGHLAGGHLAFRAPSTVYLASGDYHLDGMRAEGPPIAQDPQAQYGKMLAIDIDTGASRILSMGHRNPQGLTLAPDGQLYSSEHGPRGGDELNRIEEAANYGWPVVSFGTTYQGTRIPGSQSFARHETFTAPLMSWVPSPAISAIAAIDGFHPAWEGDLVIGTLVDESILRVRLQNGVAVYSERIEIGARIRDIHQHSDGRLVLWTDDREIVFLTPQERDDEWDTHFAEFVAAEGIEEVTARRVQSALGRCTECHSLAAEDHERAPSLARIYGDPVAATSYEGYSDALKGLGGVWTEERLIAYLTDPEAVAPGTSMPAAGLSDPAALQTLIAYLRDLEKVF